MRKRQRPNWPLRLCIGSVLLAALIHTVALPIVDYVRSPIGSSPNDRELRISMFADDVIRHSLESVVGVWILFLGASIGSFLNVVVYRLPRGRSLVAKGSYCPHCRVPIRSTDNIPVIGWLKLRGRCRACRLPISSRYPIVEAWVGLLYFALFLIELASGGANLPGVQSAHIDGVSGVVLEGRWDLCGIVLFHALLFSIYVPAILIRWDGHRLPRKLIAFAVIFPAATAPLFPWLIAWLNRSRATLPLTQQSIYPWTAIASLNATSSGDVSTQSMLTMAIGTTVGLIIGLLIGALSIRLGWRVNRGGSELSSAIFGFAWAGAFLGWQSVFAIASWWVIVLGTTMFLSIRFTSLRDVSLLAWIALATFLHVITWSFTSRLDWLPSEVAQARWLLVTSLVAFVGTAVLVWSRSALKLHTAAQRIEERSVDHGA